MRLNFFAIYKKNEKKKTKKIRPYKTTFPILTGVALTSHSLSFSRSLFLSLFLTSCRTSACLLLLHQGPFPPPYQLSVLAGPAAPTVHLPHPVPVWPTEVLVKTLRVALGSINKRRWNTDVYCSKQSLIVTNQ